MCAVNHDIKMVSHLMIDHLNWIEDATVKDEIKTARELVQTVLMPGRVPGGSVGENIGK